MKIKKKVLSVLLVGAMTLGVVGCSNKAKETSEVNNISVVMITDAGGINDESFNQSAWNGMQSAGEKYGVDVSYIESKQDSDYAQNIEIAIDNEADLVMGVGFKLADAMLEASQNYPEQHFVMIDATYDEIPENMSCVTFNEEESGYQAGLVIGKMAEQTGENKFGFIGGMDIPTVTRFADGYEKALKEINPNNELKVQITNSFTDASKGRAIATQMYQDGIETIFVAGGVVNNGAIEVARELDKRIVGVDMPMSGLAPENIVTSALKNINIGVETSIYEFMLGEFKGGINSVYDKNNNGVSYEKTNLIPQNVIDFVDSKIK